MTEEPEQVLDIDEVLEEDDLFGLAIRGHAAVEGSGRAAPHRAEQAPRARSRL